MISGVTSMTSRLVTLLLLLMLGVGCSSLPKSERVTARQERAELTFQSGLRQYRGGRYEQAAALFQQALAMHAAVDDRAGTARALASLGRSRLALEELDLAASDFQRALDAARGLDRPELEAEALGGLAAVALETGRPDDARHWLEAGLALPLTDPSSARAVLLHDLGMAHRDLGDAAAAEGHLRRALAMHEALGVHLGVAADCHALAVLLADRGDLAAARDLARRALSRDKAGENPPGVAADLTLLGRLAWQDDDHAAAADYYRRAQLAWSALGRAQLAAEAGLGAERSRRALEG